MYAFISIHCIKMASFGWLRHHLFLWRPILVFFWINCVYSQSDGSVRLEDGFGASSGRVEVYYNSQWNKVCDYFFTLDEAEVVCRQLGYDNVQLRNGDFDYGTSGINSYVQIFCIYSGSLDLNGCSISPLISPTYCSAAGVDCGYGSYTTTITPTDSIGIYDIRLVDGPSSNEGRIEIWYNGQWNTICGSTWTHNSAEVVCRQLGYDTEDVEISTGYYGQGSGPIQHAQCFGWEYTLDDCTLSSGIYLCNHDNDAGVRCGYTSSGTTSRRLIGTMAFVGVALFLITIAAIVAVVFVCSQQKAPAGATVGMQQLTTLTTTTPGPTQASVAPMPAPVSADVPV
ncbi:neurotrypsin-like [Lytechinus variegatus]|uniref:neurotrypsin-like n=1 Tax=Lytechinus variegatus TaxID=7654 RepID=UPI001BB2BBB5|nr:neurotrypsin-like [Lytechinus variegatus]